MTGTLRAGKSYGSSREGRLRPHANGVLKLVLAAFLLLSSGCASMLGSVTQGFASNLSDAILNSDDPAMVRDGAPAYLILIDSLVSGSPDNAALLAQSAELHSAYAGAFVADAERAKKLHEKAKAQIFASTCASLTNGCDLDTRAFPDFLSWVQSRRASEVPELYSLASIWAGWIQANSDDFGAVAQLARVKALMTQVAELDGEHANGGAYLYLGVFETLLPPAMGGKPEIGKGHFERVLDISSGQHLMAKVMYADQYARLMFDRALHDQLLGEVLDAEAQAPGLTLMNTVAKEQAKELLDSADDYF
ncbi:MAG TPA: hypothetical protein DCP57_05115 [Gammaproteobacteria bacterium]|jgi:hypothetical protein|nr:hypothetical protein [Gammaproteobacteria bacterium]